MKRFSNFAVLIIFLAVSLSLFSCKKTVLKKEISGQVVDSLFNPIPFALIDLSQYGAGGLIGGKGFLGGTYSCDAEGRFSFEVKPFKNDKATEVVLSVDAMGPGLWSGNPVDQTWTLVEDYQSLFLDPEVVKKGEATDLVIIGEPFAELQIQVENIGPAANSDHFQIIIDDGNPSDQFGRQIDANTLNSATFYETMTPNPEVYLNIWVHNEQGDLHYTDTLFVSPATTVEYLLEY